MLGRSAMAQAVSVPGETFDRAAFAWPEKRCGHSSMPATKRALEAFLVSTGVVALAEIGDKTQLLAFVLAARFRKPRPIILGILTATLANHALAGAIGSWLTSVVGPSTLRIAIGVSFIAMAIWTLVPDRFDESRAKLPHAGVFSTALVAFFLAEMGDKTQIATIALAARYHAFVTVVAGTTLGMMIANVPAVLVGGRLAHRLPIRLVHGVAAAIFLALGIGALAGLSPDMGAMIH